MNEGNQQGINEITCKTCNSVLGSEVLSNIKVEDGLKEEMRLEAKGPVVRRLLKDRTVGTERPVVRRKQKSDK